VATLLNAYEDKLPKLSALAKAYSLDVPFPVMSPLYHSLSTKSIQSYCFNKLAD